VVAGTREDLLVNGMGWRARIETAEGTPCGAGLLVSASQVLTCAHVVDGLTWVRVAFPGVAGADQLPAKVAWRGPWRRTGDRGDLALIELASSAPLQACEFSRPDVLRPRPGRTSHELRALGFPRHHGHDGIHVTLRTSDDRLLREEWLQIDVEQAHLQSLSKGFSGAGAWIPESGQVAGVITDAVLNDDGSGFIGRMLPLTTIRRYWEGVDDLLPLSWLEPRPRQELRAAVDGATVTTRPGEVFKMAFPKFLRAPDFETPWAAIRYVGECVSGDDRMWIFLSKLIPYLDGSARFRLTDWARRWLPAAVDELQQAKAPVTSIVIMLRTPTRNGKTHVELTARSIVNRSWTGAPYKIMVRRDQIQAKTEKVITSQVNQLRGPDWMIEFAVRPDEMSLPFEQWQFREPGASLPRPMRSVPVIVWHVARLDPGNFASYRVRQRWQILRARGETTVTTVSCHLTHDFEEFRNWLDADDALCALAYAVSPRREWLEAALDTGIPVMVWPRRSCTGSGEAHDTHETFLSQITAALSASDPDRLPVEVMRLRKQARSPVSGNEHHYGWNLTLFWDDPTRLPDPPLTNGG
jgi:hypothetical protein